MGKTVLVVDDSAYMRGIIKNALTGAGYEIIGEADNGEAAISQALSLNPDLITLDNLLPDMLGVDILRVIKRDSSLRSKVVMVSAVGQDMVVREGISSGAEAYLIKPFTAEQLLNEVNQVWAP